MQWTDEKDKLMFREVIGEGVFDHKSGRRERGTSRQNAATTLNLIDGYPLTARAFRDRVRFLPRTIVKKSCQEKENQNLLNMILYCKI